MKSVMGIDPGLNGGIAICQGTNIQAYKTPTTEDGIDIESLNDLIKKGRRFTRIAYLEKVAARPGQGVVSMFTFGKVFGATHALLIANGYTVVLVTPQKWMKIMHIGFDGDTKQKSRNAFEKIFPGKKMLATERSRVPHEGMIEASLIAVYGYTTEKINESFL